jgi:hypothetical protein
MTIHNWLLYGGLCSSMLHFCWGAILCILSSMQA